MFINVKYEDDEDLTIEGSLHTLTGVMKDHVKDNALVDANGRSVESITISVDPPGWLTDAR